MPLFEQLRLPPVLLDMVMAKRGLVLVAGATGSGKSTTLAAMIDYRNSNQSGHILTIEDPIEYLYEHRRSIVNQREIGIDTQTYQLALQNALREAPDLIMIGEIRDKETMQSALLHTLDLCRLMIDANDSYHALSRIINLFPYDARSAVLSDLSIGLRAIISQRLIRNVDNEMQPAVEILMNTSLIAELIKSGEFPQIKEAMEQSLYPGSQTFEQSLCRLYLDGTISYDEAMSASDSPTNLAWLINQNSPTSRVENLETSVADRETHRTTADFATLTIDPAMLDRQQQHYSPTRSVSPRLLAATKPVASATIARMDTRARPTLALTRELVARRSVTPDDGGCQALIAARLAPLGFRCETIASGGVTNLWARRGAARPLVCFAGHTDVVPTGPRDAWTSTRSCRSSAPAASTAAAPRT